MKKTKIVALTASLALSASLVLGMTACAGGVNSLYGDDYTYTAPTMTGLRINRSRRRPRRKVTFLLRQVYISR